MKKLFLLILASALFMQSYAQATVEDPKVKKLEQDLKAHPQPDTTRVNILNELGRVKILSAGALDTMANEILSLSRKLNYPKGEVYGLIKKSRGALLKNDTTNAFALLRQAKAIAGKLDDKTHLAIVYSRFASAYNLSAGDNKRAYTYYLKSDSLARSTRDKKVICDADNALADFLQISVGDYAKAMDWALKAEKSAEEINDLDRLATAWSSIASVYTGIGDRPNALLYYTKALNANKKLGNKRLEYNLLNRIGEMNRLSGKYPEAIKAYEEGLQSSYTTYNTELTESNLADVYVRLNNLPLAFKYGFKSLTAAKSINDVEGEEWINGILARAYLKKNMPDSAIFYALTGYSNAVKSSTIEFKRDNSEALANAYELKKDYTNAYSYYKLFISYRDSMLNSQVSNQTALLQYNYALAKNQAQIATLNQDKKNQRYFLTGSFVLIGLVIITVIVLLRSNRLKQKANILLSKQKQMIEEQRDQTNKALGELQVTQKQLVQSEKMASLGELTAGIAHEIQNPLNFVNNFSEVNTELIDDLEQEIKEGNVEEVKALAENIRNNQKKITQHGRRADFIVKGMLQHSRTNTGERQQTNINVLAEEFLKLSYHGLRAKDKSFNAELTTHFDENLPAISVVSQDVGRVLLNLFNNAFYAVNQKSKTAPAGYKPEISVKTALQNNGVVVWVRDNGNGIPAAIREKIMQPFFTTKASGEGTGLGLSISYDIVVKGHNGSLSVDTKEGEYTEFRLILPVS